MTIPRAPLSSLPTHDVFNMPPPIGDQDFWAGDTALRHWTTAMGADWATDKLAAAGASFGREEVLHWSEQANRHGPELRAFDRNGMRLNAVEFHPAYHQLMDLAISNEIHNFAWRADRPGAHVGHAALTYMFSQAEGGVMCPMAMAYSALPSLAYTPALEAIWKPRLMSTDYDQRDIPAEEKIGAMIGMFMTEKQGGSDVRANSTAARPLGGDTGMGAEYLLTGHKFFCSAPMCDAFLVLAGTEAGGISCFLVPRWRPDGTRNALMIQRLKDKLGNKSNASTEMEFQDTYGVMIGDEGRGIRTIIDMVSLNRLYCAMSSAGQMRGALAQALHHTTHRSAFQKRLIQQPLMKNVLADLAVEVEGALALGLRTAKAVDAAGRDEHEAAMARILTPIAKYWNCKRAPAAVFEALECHGGPGYVEEAPLARMYREAPLNSIWEGPGNVQCLDVLRVLGREPEAVEALFSELGAAKGADSRLDAAIDEIRAEFEASDGLEARMRGVTELMALTLQGALLTQHGGSEVAEAFCASRLAPRWRGAFGTLPAGVDLDAVVERAVA